MIDRNEQVLGADFGYDSFILECNRAGKRKFKTTDEVHVYDITLKWLKKNIPSNINIDLSHELKKFKEYWSKSPWKRPRSGVMGFRKWLRWAVKYQQTKQGGNDAN